MDIQCNSCHQQDKINSSGKWGIASGIILAILPKCPFCIMAFTSTAMLCGEGAIIEDVITHNSAFTILITGFFGLITLGAILGKRKGKKTGYAFSIALLGIAMIMYSVARSGGQSLYYAGLIFVFIGVWLNGSLLWLWRNMKGGVLERRRDVVG